MRVLVAVVAVCCGCGKPSAVRDATKDGEITVDAPALPRCANPVAGQTVSLRKLPEKVTGIATLATAPPNDPRLFVVEVQGAIRIYKDERLLPTPFIDLGPDASGPVVSGTELGLLGLTFHPRYAETGTFFVYYTTGDTLSGTLRDVVARCAVSADDPDRARPTCDEVLSIPDPGSNHNGGMIDFRDGLLYIGTGDGGGPNQTRNSQDPNVLLGKMLRIDVDRTQDGKEYGIPLDNPFVAGGGAPEVFMLGLRNPWRWSFDRETGDLWIGDVGRSAIEELDVLRPAQQRGANLGWSMYEGSQCFTPPCEPVGKVFPKDERERTATNWESIIAGQVYRGSCYPDLVGWHFYTDNAVGGLVRARLRADDTLEIVDLVGEFPLRPVSIHEDARGELYMTDVSGFVYRLEVAPP